MKVPNNRSLDSVGFCVSSPPRVAQPPYSCSSIKKQRDGIGPRLCSSVYCTKGSKRRESHCSEFSLQEVKSQRNRSRPMIAKTMARSCNLLSHTQTIFHPTVGVGFTNRNSTSKSLKLPGKRDEKKKFFSSLFSALFVAALRSHLPM